MAKTTHHLFTLLDGKIHDRAAFSCGKPSLDDYLKKRASQDVKKRAAVVHVMTTADDPATILGYYTLNATSIFSNDIPEAIRKSLPRYDQVSATLMGRLALDEKFIGQGLGSILMMNALHRALEASRNIASFAVVVDALDNDAKAFYLHYGFIPFEAYPMKLFLPMTTIEQQLGKL